MWRLSMNMRYDYSHACMLMAHIGIKHLPMLSLHHVIPMMRVPVTVTHGDSCHGDGHPPSLGDLLYKLSDPPHPPPPSHHSQTLHRALHLTVNI